MTGLFLFVAFLIAALACAFALQNTAPITVSFLTWEIQGSLALILLFTLALGALIAASAFFPTWIRHRFELAGLKRKLSELEGRSDEPSGEK